MLGILPVLDQQRADQGRQNLLEDLSRQLATNGRQVRIPQPSLMATFMGDDRCEAEIVWIKITVKGFGRHEQHIGRGPRAEAELSTARLAVSVPLFDLPCDPHSEN